MSDFNNTREFWKTYGTLIVVGSILFASFF